MSIQLYNTLTNKKEPLETLEPGKVKMYVCGPTVYNKAHIGHAMSAMVFDIIRRYLEYRGYDVQFAMNFTDVDDKIIKRANEMGVDPFKLAEGYIEDFQQDMKDLNIKPATFNPRATQEIDEIISIQEFLKQHSANSFRYLILNSAYRNPIIFSEETLSQAEKAVERMKGSLKPANPKTEVKDEDTLAKFNAKIASVKEDFITNMDDDFNSAGALGCIFELAREINSMRDQGASQAQLDPAQNQIREFADVFGLVLEEEKSDAGQSADVFIQMLVDLRFALKKEKNWPLADQIRKELGEQGITIEDSKEGSLWYRNA